MELVLDLPFSDPDPVVEEPSVLEYAREQGICVDYTTELPRLVDICLSFKNAFDEDPRDLFEDDLTNAAAAAHELTQERLALNRDAAFLLRSTLTLREPSTDDTPIMYGRQIRDLKQELPVLRTDAELDMLHFGTRVEPDFRDLRTRLPSEDLDDENDEGFEWPAKYFTYPAQCDSKIKSEKLAMTRDALTFLQSAVKDEFLPEDEERIMAEGLGHTSNTVLRHMTPPLLPLSPPLTPYIPSSPANRLPLIPESSDSITAEAKALEQQIMAKDSLIRYHSGSSDSMLLDVANLDALFDATEVTSSHFSDPIPMILKRKADDLKVEGPLTPPVLSDSPMKKLKSVSFSNMIQVGDSLQPWSDEHHSGTSDSQSITRELIREIEPIAEEARRRVENEKLTGADTVSRVNIPVLDFTLPVAPWDEFSQRKDSKRRSGIMELEAQMRFLQRVKRDDMKSATTWRGMSDLELSWGWFASPTSTIKLNENLHGENEFNKIQAELKAGNIATSANEVWKKDGLRILAEEHDEEDDEEDEIEPAEFEERNDMEALIRKRKLMLAEQEETMEAQRKHRQIAVAHLGSATHNQPRQDTYGFHYQRALPVPSQDPPKASNTSNSPRTQQPSLVPSHHKLFEEEQKEAPTELMFGGFSASTALHRFMQTQGKAIEIAKASARTKTSSAPSAQALRSIEPSLFVGERPESIAERPSRDVPEQPPPPDLPPSSFIVSSTLLQRRPLLKQIDCLHPKAETIYRDYSLPHSIAAEADIILSPSTGVILTTLQQIKQAPLPGQVARSPVKERISMLQERYERLVVLVSEGLREELGYSRPEDARDKETLKDLDAFATHLEGDVVVEYIRGGEQTLAGVVVENMAKYGLPHGGKDIGDIRLFAVETTWELFLRRTGINPYAAQVILTSLKVPTAILLPPVVELATSYAPQRSVEAAGLPMFLLMEREDRAKRFQAIMGGRRILDTVSGLLDQRWLSASNGYWMQVSSCGVDKQIRKSTRYDRVGSA